MPATPDGDPACNAPPAINPQTRHPDGPFGRVSVKALAVGFVAVFVLALLADPFIARWLHDMQWDTAVRRAWWGRQAKGLGTGILPVLCILVVLLTHRFRWRPAALIAAAASLSSVGEIIKWVVGRTRPYKIPAGDGLPHPYLLDPLAGGLHGLLYTPNLSLPSGHAAVAFAAAGSMAVLLPGWRVVWFAVASTVAIERVMENAHWASDVVAGAGIGIASVYAAMALGNTRWLAEPDPTRADSSG